MRRGAGWTVGRAFGIPVVIDYSWPIIALLITWSLYLDFEVRAITVSRQLAIVAAAVGAILFFGSVVVHELSHSVIALRRGIGVRRIRLFIFGGVSEIEAEATTAKDEFAIAIAGPLSSFALGGAFLVAALIVPSSWLVIDRLVVLMTIFNLALGAFNLVPGFPLDGGRVLRALVWRFTGSRRRATWAAVTMGKVVALLLAVAGGLLVAGRGDLLGLWYLGIAWFLYRAAAGTLAHSQLLEALSEATAADLMTPTPAAVPGGLTVRQFVDGYVIGTRPVPYPVVVDGRVRGLVMTTDAAASPDHLSIAEIMSPLAPDDVIDGSTAAGEVFRTLGSPDRTVVVTDGGRMIGVISAKSFQPYFAQR